MRASWSTLKSGRRIFGKVVTELNDSKLVGEGSVSNRGPHVQVTDMKYFNPPADAFLMNLRVKDRRSAKEWEYVNLAVVWAEMAGMESKVAKTERRTAEEMGRFLALDDLSNKATLEVLGMRAQYFRDITEHSMETAWKVAFLLEQGKDDVFSES